jgi:hypothetical protein
VLHRTLGGLPQGPGQGRRTCLFLACDINPRAARATLHTGRRNGVGLWEVV